MFIVDINKLREHAHSAAGVSLIIFGAGTALITSAPIMMFVAADVISGERMDRVMPNLVRSALGVLPVVGVIIVGLGINLLDPDC